PRDQVESGRRRRREDLLAVLPREVREHLWPRLPKRQLLRDLLLQRTARRTLQVIAGVHRQSAAALAGERLLDVGLRGAHAASRRGVRQIIRSTPRARGPRRRARPRARAAPPPSP